MIKNKLFSRILFLAFVFSFLNSYIAFLFVKQYESQYDTYSYVKSNSIEDLYLKLKQNSFLSDKTNKDCSNILVDRQSQIVNTFVVTKQVGTNVIAIKVSSNDKSKNELCLNSLLEDIIEFNKKADILRSRSLEATKNFIISSKISISLQSVLPLRELFSPEIESTFSRPYSVKNDINEFFVIFLTFILSFIAFIYIYYLSKKIEKKIAKIVSDLF